MVRITNETKGTEIAERAHVARSFLARLIGLLGTSSLPKGGGIVIEPCSSVHTIGMMFTIDVIYVDSSKRVVKAVSMLKPFRMSAVRGKCSAIELPKGTITATNTTAGDQLAFA